MIIPPDGIRRIGPILKWGLPGVFQLIWLMGLQPAFTDGARPAPALVGDVDLAPGYEEPIVSAATSASTGWSPEMDGRVLDTHRFGGYVYLRSDLSSISQA